MSAGKRCTLCGCPMVDALCQGDCGQRELEVAKSIYDSTVASGFLSPWDTLDHETKDLFLNYARM